MMMSGLVISMVLVLGQEVPAPSQGLAEARQMRRELSSIVADEARRLEDHAARLEAGGDKAGAAEARALIEREGPTDGPLRFVPLPEVHEPAAATARANAPAQAIRRETADSLYSLARKAAEPGVQRFGIAAECLRAVILREPDHREARRLLGFVEHGNGGWATPQAAENLKAGMVLHPVFGWVPADWVAKLDQGQLPAPRSDNQTTVTWLPAAEADALRRDFARRPWKISTEHFDVWTNVSLSEAIAFGRRLEAFDQFFETILADAVNPSVMPLAQRFRDPASWGAPVRERHMVWYLASREEYVAIARNRLKRDESQSLGFYTEPREARRFRQEPRTYFYRDEGQELTSLATLFHEASHQVLFESGGPSQYDQNVGNYWVWEGLGTAFETFRPETDGSYSFGGFFGPRLAKAREDVVEWGRFVSLADLCAMNQVRFRDPARESSNYALGMAWAVHLLMHDRGRYRDAFLDYVRDSYRGRFRPGGDATPLIERLGEPAEAIDEGFRAALTAQGKQSAGEGSRAPAPE